MPIVWVCLCVAILSMVYLLLVYRRLVKVRAPKQPIEVADDELPGVSVIVYVRDNAEGLRKMLPVLLAQEYPAGKMEVIVVNDGSVEDVKDVVNYLGMEHRNLRITFVPHEAHNLSRKKLAISLGVKAAANDVIVLTDAECEPVSPAWLRLMAAPFSVAGGEKDVVLGWGMIKGLRGMMLRFDAAVRGAMWLAAAQQGHPYRGTGFNLAYRRSLFFREKGFSRSLNLHNGDDDLFINQIADGDNTAVVVSPEAQVIAEYQRPEAVFRDLRLRHCFTARMLPKGRSRLMAGSTAAMWLWLAATAVGITFSLPNWFPALLFIVLIPALWIPLTVSWLRTASTLGIRLSAVTLWWMMLWRWIPSQLCRYRCTSRKRHNYTWTQK